MQDFYDAIKTFGGWRGLCASCRTRRSVPSHCLHAHRARHIFGLDGPQGLQRIRMQVDTYARTYQEALSLHDEIL
jgi:hypothetical protein